MSHDESKPVRVVSPGVVRCLLKQTYYLRIPQDNDLESKTVRLPPDTDVPLEYREFDLVRTDLIQLDQKNIVRIVKYPEFLPPETDLNIEVYEQGVLIASNISSLNFVGQGATVVDAGNGRADIAGGTPIGGADPEPVGTTNIEGVNTEAARTDHVHQGVHSIAASTLGSQRYGDLILQAGSNIQITDMSGTFTFDVVVGATDELQVTQQPSPALAVNYQGGKISAEGIPYMINPGSLAGLPASETIEIYVDIDGVVKFIVGDVPGNAVWLATVTTDPTSVTGVIDRRVFLNQNLISGLTSDITTIVPDASSDAGTSARYARADHTHAIACGPAVSLTPNLVNAEGSSSSFARADHVHNIAAAPAVTLTPAQANAEGTSSSFARADHVHNIPTDTAVTLNAGSLNTEGNAATFARSNHTHAIPTDIAVSLTPDAANAAGTSLSFSRADHVHNVPADVAIALAPDAGNTEGVSTSFARADHTHNIPTAIAVSISSATNTQGSAVTFSRSDHVHAHGNLLGGTLHATATQLLAGFMSAADKTRLDNITEPDIQKDDITITSDVEIINFEGPNVSVTDEGSNKVTIFIGDAPGLHASTHLPNGSDPITTASAVTLTALTVNGTGTTNSLARSDHTHAITTGNVGFLGSGVGSNQTGTGAALARADHVHRWEEVTSFAGLPGSPTNGQIVYANYGLYKGFYAYDSARAKWLSVELLQVGWNSSSNTNGVNVVLTAHNDDTQQDNDYPIIQPITLTGLIGAQVNAITTGNETRFEISTYDLASSTLTQNVASVTLTTVGDFSARDLTLNVDVADLNVLSARRVKTSGSASVTRPMMLLQYRSRLT